MSKINAGQAPSTLIPEYIGSAFDAVLTCADNINDIKPVSENINDVVTVANNILDVNKVITNVDDVALVADNIDYVKDVAEGIEGLPVSGYIGDTPPTQPKVGATWYCTLDGRNYTWYEDVDSGQWVESSPQSTADDPHLAGNIFALWKRSAAEAGYNLVVGSFEEGGVLTSSSDVLWHKGLDSIYSWGGAYPTGGYVVAPGTDPTAITGYVPRTAVVLRSVVSLTFPTIADINESQLSIGTTVIVENYSAACKSGVLFFKVAALRTGVHDGGKYINLTGYQLVQNLRKPFSVMAWGACGNSNGTSGNGADDRNAIYNCYKYAASSSARSAEVFFPRPDGNNCYRMGSGFEVNESDYTYFVGEGGHYTASKILVDFNGIAIYRNSGQFCNSFRNLVFQSANPSGYTAAAAIYSVGTVESTLEEVSFLDFGGIACNLKGCFGVRVVHPLVAGNYSVGLKLSGGNGNLLDTPIFQDNLGTACIVEGAGWTILNPYLENNCKRNDPATENGSYYNLYINATQTTIVGGTLNQYPQDTKVPIRIASADVTIINMNVYNLAATEVAHIESSAASLSLIVCSWHDKVSGYTANLFTSVTPLAGYRKADVTLSGRSVSDNISSAWCNFNGTLASPIAPRQGSNVSNITKLGVGTYRVNFQTTMATNTYMVNTAAGGSNNAVYVSYGTKDAGFVEIYVRDAAGALTDVSDISVEIKEIKPV